ncbi:MAG: heavy metal translocating P-type ATPase, partial [Eubacterium sp.]|nr:heavy metal translocating P-type ATPase [Eubacterium sp.]
REKYRFAHRAAKKAFDISRVNIVVALSVKAIVLVLAVFMKKEVPMWFAAFSDVGISVLAILNSLRALKIK